MSQENVELTLRLIDAWNRRDVEAAIALSDPEALWFPPLEGITEGRAYRGHDEIRQYYEDLAEFSEAGHAEYPEIRDLGDQVLALGRIWLRFAGGVELDQELAGLYKWQMARWKMRRSSGLDQSRSARRRPRSRRAVGIAALDEKRRSAWNGRVAVDCHERRGRNN